MHANQEPVYQTIHDKPIPVWFKQFTDRFSLPDLSNLNDSRQRGLFVPGFKKKIETSCLATFLLKEWLGLNPLRGAYIATL
jgi:hypothetical protein